jgi:acyl-CoA synthetase (AMP-forming)/AMP-acid ligase II
MHSMPRQEMDDLLLEACRLRFAEHRELIEAVGKAAERAGVEEVDEFDDLVPLLFAHAASKSYPAALLDRKRYDLLTRWLNKLTAHDLSGVDTSGCTDIDSWIDVLDEQTPLEVITSSGTTGTLSIIPKDKHGAATNMRNWRVLYFQTFGVDPRPEDLDPVVDVIWPTFAQGKLGHLRMASMLQHYFTGDEPSRFHALYGEAVSTDLMFLASKLRAAASRGELDRVEIEPALLARKAEFEALQASMPEDVARFLQQKLTELAGHRVFVLGAYNLLYELATEGLSKGVTGVFASDSVVASGGGAKGIVLPDNWQEPVLEFFGVDRIVMGYGMSEVSAFHVACEKQRYHVQPWIVPYVLDPDTNEPHPREGVQVGRAAFYDPANFSHWGGLMSGDEIELSYEPCGCGRTTVHIGPNVERYSEKQGDDRITCAATQQLQHEAIDFLRGIEG